jgi:transposase-like protein
MRQSTKFQTGQPASVENLASGSSHSPVLAFQNPDEFRSQLDLIIRNGAQQMLQAAIEAEVEDFLAAHAEKRDARGNRPVVRNGRLPARSILTGAGKIEVSQPRVRDKSPVADDRVVFSPSILPPYLRRSPSVDELMPWLYLKGISTKDFVDALKALVGEHAGGLSPNTIVRLKERWSAE